MGAPICNLSLPQMKGIFLQELCKLSCSPNGPKFHAPQFANGDPKRSAIRHNSRSPALTIDKGVGLWFRFTGREVLSRKQP